MRTVGKTTRALLTAGLDGLPTERERRQAQAANAMGLGFLLVSLPYLALFVASGSQWPTVVLSLGCVGYASPIVLNRRGLHLWAKVAPLTVAGAVIYFFIGALGPEANLQACAFMLTGWAFNLFDVRRNPRLLLSCALLPGLMYFLSEHGVVPPVPDMQMPLWARRLMASATLVAAYGLLAWVMWTFYRDNQNNEDRLVEAVQQLRSEVQERERAQAVAEQERAAAERAGLIKSQFLAVMSHELRTPLSGVVGSLELLRDESLTASQQELAVDIQTSTCRLLRLLNNLLDVSMMDQGKVHLSRSPFDLVAALESVAVEYASCALQKGIALILDIEPDVPTRIVGDETRLQQIVQNLVENAIKFTVEGSVVVTVRMIHVKEAALPRMQIDVRDTGIGIGDELRSSIFNHFSQHSTTLDRRYEGAGLGLAISRLLVEAMDGMIFLCDTATERGSLFRVEVPCQPAEEAPSHVGDKSPAWTVVVEGRDASWGNSLRHTLSRLGARVVNDNAPGHNTDLVFIPTPASEEEVGCEVKAAATRYAVSNHAVVLVAPAGRRTGKILELPFERKAILRLLPTPGASGIDTPGRKQNSVVSRPLEGLRILLAEDNRVNQKVILSMLRKLGAVAEAAEDGRVAVSKFKMESWDLVLMDIQMPVMDGLAATREIRTLERQEGERGTPVIAVSANISPTDIAAAKQAGVDDYLAKPLGLEALATAILRQLGKAAPGATACATKG